MYLKKPDKDVLLEVIAKKSGIKVEVARAFGVNRRTLNNWIHEDEDVKNAFEDADEGVVDLAESLCIRRMQGIPILKKNPKTGANEIVGYEVLPSDKLIEFTLRTKGGKRGWSEKKMLDITSNGNAIGIMPVQPIPNPHFEKEE